MITPDRTIRTTCPYCGVGCQMNLNVKDDYIYSVEAPFDAAPNYGMLCVKGRFGTDYVRHPGRVKTPLIRTNREEGRSAPPVWREATWEEALDLVADELVRVVRQYSGDAVASFASAKATNEDNYVFQKFIRSLMGTNNIDHCSRLCHAGSVAGLQISIGSSAMSNSIAEMENLEAFIVTGSNTTETHPVIANFLKRAVRKNGARLIVVDPRRIDMTNFATLWLRQNPGTDVAVFQAMAHTIVKENLYDPDFIAARTEGFNEYLESLDEFTPEWAESVSGVKAEEIRPGVWAAAVSLADCELFETVLTATVDGVRVRVLESDGTTARVLLLSDREDDAARVGAGLVEPGVFEADVAVSELQIAERHGYTIFDALIIAAALHAGCDILYSEDMQHGMTIARQLRIVDPFRSP